MSLIQLRGFGPCKLANLKLRRAKIDKQAVLNPSRFQVGENLTFVFHCHCLSGFKFDNQNILDQQIRKILANQCAIFIKHSERMLLLNPGAFL